MDISRRKFMLTGAAAIGGQTLALAGCGGKDAGAATIAPQPDRELPARIEFAPWPFTLGVASGDPTPTAIVIWTRLAPDPLGPQGGLTGPAPVNWAVATDDQFDNTVATGVATATPAAGGAVHVDVTGLTPDTEYFYTFWTVEGPPSQVGRMTTPPQGVANNMRFALVSCQSIVQGRFAAFDRMVEENLDFILHVGDYIYESPLGAAWPPEVQVAAADLESYRARYALYRGDPQLRAAHQAVPWVMSWDDHEVVNEYWANPDPAFMARRAAAYQAWYEHMPIRPPAGLPDPDTGFQIYRQLKFGDLIDVLVLDTRQYRDRHPCSRWSNPTGCPDPDLDDPERTILGVNQKQWLKDKLATSTADWRCIASPVTMSDVKLGDVVSYTVPWQGYQAERAEVLNHLAANDINNVVVLSGDWHRSVVSTLKTDFTDITSPDIASEFGVTSVTSPGAGDQGGIATFLSQLNYYPLNLNLRYFESELHGYVVCDVTKQNWRSTYRSVDKNDPMAPAETLAVFEVTNGSPGVNAVSFADGQLGNPYPSVVTEET